MDKFDFSSSINRHRVAAQKSFDTIFWYLTTLNGLVFILVIYLLFFQENFYYGLAEIILAIILILQSYYLAKRYAVILHRRSNNSADYLSLELVDFFNKVTLAAKKEGISEITIEYLFGKLPLSSPGKMIFNPVAKYVIENNDKLIALGEADNINQFTNSCLI